MTSYCDGGGPQKHEIEKMKAAKYSPLATEDLRVVKQGERIRRRDIVIVVLVAISSVLLLLITALFLVRARGAKAIDPVAESPRFDCYPEGVATDKLCEARGCYWDSSSSPMCFYGPGFGYEVNGEIQNTSYGYTANAVWKAGQVAPFDGIVQTLRVDVYYDTPYRVRVKISDPSSDRYEVPWPPRSVTSKALDTLYKVSIETETFNFTVSRADSGMPIFSTGTGFIFEDQFLQISALLPSSNIYGLGEHTSRLRLPTNTTLTMFSQDTPPIPAKPTEHLYGVHPFYLGLEQDGRAHGVFLLNSNAMEAQLQSYPSITYRTIGGLLDFYYFLGPGPDQVIQQYTELIGRPYLPPYWSLGFHLCRWGYMTANNTQAVVDRMREKGIPQDTQWNDIDYMRSNLDFTFDPVRYAELPSLVDDLHRYGQKYVMILDPGISSMLPPGQYAPFDDGLKSNVFVMNSTGQPLIGAVWPGSTAWPDFTHPNASSYWANQISQFQSEVAFDGLWIDMNEPSDFVDGSNYGCPPSQLEHPPYLPLAIRSLRNGIFTKTLCMTASQFLSIHYNLHSLYGLTEANATMSALTTTLNKRSLVISRSTYPGSGAHGGHWLGDNASQWPDLAISIPGLLQFSLFGVPLVGADICGFSGNTTQELCTRWQQLGAFYPFSRNHNAIGMIDQDPAVFDDVSVNSTRDALLLRYRLLPHLYTLFYFAHTNGTTVARPLFFEFPADNNTWAVDTQFMWGNSLLISPVLAENTSTVEAYFPQDRWFELRTGLEVTTTGQTVLLDAPYEFIPLHVRGGAVIPMQAPNTTTLQSRKNPFSLLVVLNDQATASGYLYLDDGESLDAIETEDYSLLQFSVMEGFLGSVLIGGRGCSAAGVAVLGGIQVFGLTSPPTTVSVNGTAIPNASFEWDQTNKVLAVQLVISNMNYAFNVTWK